MEFIQRTEFLERLIAFKDMPVIKILTGIRRCGKSTLMEIYKEWLLGHGVEAVQIVSVNFEDFDNFGLRDPAALHAYVTGHLAEERMTYIFFDEIQHVMDFPDVVNSLHIKRNVDLYITGSNARLLSGEIATLLSGRYVEISMLPLSLREYSDGIGDRFGLQEKYAQYASFGAFPFTLFLPGSTEKLSYLSGIYDSVIVKDIMLRHRISDPLMLESVVRFAADNIGNILSSKKIADTMGTNGRKIDQKTVERYLSALCEAFVLYRVGRYNIRGRQLLKSLDKYYLVDMGLRRLLLGSKAYDVGRVLENIVFLELARRGKKVYVGRIDELEVDFVATDNDGTTYYQVAASVRDETTLKRELASLRRIQDSYPKYILTLDDDPDSDYDGIRRTNAIRWLLG